MKRAVSISLGSSARDMAVEFNLLGERVRIERIGTDGDMERAARLFGELDGKVDAFGVGGTDLGLTVDNKYYALHSITPLIRHVKRTPVVDGSGLKNTLERRVAPYLESQIGPPEPRRVLMTSGADRWGMCMSFMENGYEGVFGDLMFGLGLPIPIRSAARSCLPRRAAPSGRLHGTPGGRATSFLRLFDCGPCVLIPSAVRKKKSVPSNVSKTAWQ